MKKNLCDAITNIEVMQHEIKDNSYRINATVKACELAELRFSSIEQELDKKNTELSYTDKRRLRNIEHDLAVIKT